MVLRSRRETYLEGKNRFMRNKFGEALEEKEKLLPARDKTVPSTTKCCLRGGHSPVVEEVAGHRLT